MKTVALVTQKGGTGKSTLAVHLAVTASRRGQLVALIDLDPQASASLWAERRGKDDFAVVTARAADLPGLLDNARQQGADLVLIDTAGRADVTTTAAIEAADLVLIPARPSLYDLAASTTTAAQVKGRNAAFVLNAVPTRGTRADEARAALADLLPVAPVHLHQLVAYSDALNDGRSVEELDPYGKAAEEIRALYDWLINV